MSKKRHRHDRNPAQAAQRAPASHLIADATVGAHPVGDPATESPVEVAHERAAPERAASESRLETAATSGDLFPMPAGLRLRAAREARGLTREEVARTAHIPTAVLCDIEADRMEAMPPIYARGYLRSFARVVGVPELDVIGVNTREHEVPPLVPSHVPSRSGRALQRWGNLLASAMLTLLVLIGVVKFGIPTVPTAPATPPELAELDLVTPARPSPAPAGDAQDASAPIADATQSAIDMGPPVAVAARTPVPVPSPFRPVMASMAPLPEAAPAAVEPESPLSARRVVLTLAQASWVELTGAEGRRIEYALLPAGTVREYQIAGNANLRIGNSRGATLSVDGTAVDLPSHSRSNVARVELGAVPAGR